ncbi:hypothetical protein AGMMS49546_29340 [Spirochaetia bacterium]|nr:hypothetical protein AGMMS49546_29340 [Spirochaetia bacterium]
MVLTLLAALFTALLLCGCGNSLVDSRFVINFPELPPAWPELLGPPRWRVEWIGPAGNRESLETGASGGIEINIPPTQPSPVLAWPFWPARGPGIVPGSFRPAGAIFPFDAAGGRLNLSWQGGIDAFFYHALARASAQAAAQAADQAAGNGSSPDTGLRVPQNFDWPRFRELFEDPGVSAEFRADPWTADWAAIAANVVKSGFDKRRFKPQAREELRVNVSRGPWIGTSPFAAPLLFEEDLPLFPVRPGTESDAWYSADGILRCAGTSWIFRPWE